VFHGLLEYGIGVLLIAGSSLFGFDTDKAAVITVLLGAAVIAIAALSDTPTALTRQLPLSSHVLLDYVVGILLIVLPFLAFSGDEVAVAFCVVVGLGYLVLTAVTRFKPAD
jgi:hypothetical protein